MAASKTFDCVRGRNRQWSDVAIRADKSIRAEVDAEEAEMNAEGPDASLGLWKRVKGWFGDRDRRRSSRVVCL
jgi:hypothetical protein